jgi:short subunit dehydrogenase-like uncharacterized protein
MTCAANVSLISTPSTLSMAIPARPSACQVESIGPYRGQRLTPVQAPRATAGTNYAALAGEVLLIRDSFGRCHNVAIAAGAHRALPRVRLRRSRNPMRSALIARPSLTWTTSVTSSGPATTSELRIWTGPFPMAGINTRMVRRSNALQGWAYGRRFRYREVTRFGAGPAAPVLAVAASTALKAVEAGLAFGPSRAVLSQLLPAPGQSLSERTCRTGLFRMQINARTSARARYLDTIEARGDPRHAATSVMHGETALWLARDRDRLPDQAGVLTPATATGTALADRLRSTGHTPAAQQIAQQPRQTPGSWPLSLPEHCTFAATTRTRSRKHARQASHSTSGR